MTMKRICFLLFALALMVSNMDARTFVLVTGVSNYGNEASNLSQTTKDAKRFKELMETQTKDITLLTSKNVTYSNVLEKLRAICNRAQANDRVIFYYSGHGMPGAICGYDSPIPYDDIIEVLNTSSAKEVLCFIDACHAGTMAQNSTDKSWMKAVKESKGKAFFVGCRPDEYSFESPFVGAGYFTQALLKGMRGKSDSNRNKEITVMELFKYVYGDVLKHSNKEQHPQLIAPESMHNVVVTKW